MEKIFDKLLHGSAAEVAAHLKERHGAASGEIACALINALDRIAALEIRAPSAPPPPWVEAPDGASRDEVILDHLINLTDQVRRLGDVLRTHGIGPPDDLGTLGPADEATVIRLTEESMKAHFPEDSP